MAIGKEVPMGTDVHGESWQITAISATEKLFRGRTVGKYSLLRKLLSPFVDCQIWVAHQEEMDDIGKTGIQIIRWEALGSPKVHLVSALVRQGETLL